MSNCHQLSLKPSCNLCIDIIPALPAGKCVPSTFLEEICKEMASITKRIKSYQEYIESHASDQTRLLRCLEKLHALDVRVQHLQDTGVGRTVNALRKEPGHVGASAKALVSKWKKMVAAEEESSEEEHNHKPSSSNHDDEDEQHYPDEYEPHDTNDETQRHLHHNSRKRSHEKKEENDDVRSEKSRRYSSSDSDNLNNKRLKNASNELYTKPIEQMEKKVIDHQKTFDSGKHLEINKSSHRIIGKHPEQQKVSKYELSTSDNRTKSEEFKQSSNLKSKTDSVKCKQHSSHHKSHEDKAKSQLKSSQGSKETSGSKTRNSVENKKTSRDSISSSDKEKYSNSHKSSKEKEKSRTSNGLDNNSSEKHSKLSDTHKQKERRSSKHESKEKHDVDEFEKSSREKNSSSKSDRSSHKNNTESNRKDRNHEKSSSKPSSSSKSSSFCDFKSNNIKDRSLNPKKKQIEEDLEEGSGDEGIGFGSGASFEEALGMVSPVKRKKKIPAVKDPVSPVEGKEEMTMNAHKDMIPVSLLAPMMKLNPLPPLEISALPDISPNYKPRPPPKLAALNQEEALTVVMSTKNQRTKVYSGNRVSGALPSLYEMCVMVLQQHIDALEYTGGVPYDILKPIVDKATPEQLFSLEHYNAYLTEDTGELWKKHCDKRFRNKQRLELESWREMYIRCQEEQEAKLKSLTANIKLSQEVKMAPTRQTKMAYVDAIVKPPRGVARKQAIHGTARLPVVSPAARVAALAGNNVVRASVARAPIAPAVPSTAHKIKKAPLMQKALQFMRSGRGGKR